MRSRWSQSNLSRCWNPLCRSGLKIHAGTFSLKHNVRRVHRLWKIQSKCQKIWCLKCKERKQRTVFEGLVYINIFFLWKGFSWTAGYFLEVQELGGWGLQCRTFVVGQVLAAFLSYSQNFCKRGSTLTFTVALVSWSNFAAAFPSCFRFASRFVSSVVALLSSVWSKTKRLQGKLQPTDGVSCTRCCRQDTKGLLAHHLSLRSAG